ncbi:MAG: phosphatidylserine decarboxylase [Fibrobacteria bacterium]|nr:phosphatidylserine decarboxylase [Fibrobacteria bacterium]
MLKLFFWLFRQYLSCSTAFTALDNERKGIMSLYSLLYLVPKNWLSAIIGKIAFASFPFGLQSIMKNLFVKGFKLNVDEAEHPLNHYPTAGDLFIRKLKPGSRPLGQGLLISPVDGKITQTGCFKGSSTCLQQIKGRKYKLSQLIGNVEDAQQFAGGKYCTIYLSPHNYHRIHVPFSGEITKISYLPGELWPVNNWSVRNIDGLFFRNERIIVHIKSSDSELLLVAVGATNVGKIVVHCCPSFVGNQSEKREDSCWIPDTPLPVHQGDELGYFSLGSTIILIGNRELFSRECSPESTVPFTEDYQGLDLKIKMGETLLF